MTAQWRGRSFRIDVVARYHVGHDGDPMTPAGGPLHLHGVLLPDGAEDVDMWVADGRFVGGPVAGATRVAGSFIAPGLVDAHAHLTLPFADCLAHRLDATFVRGATPDVPGLVLANAQRHLRSGVLAIRDAGFVHHLAIDGVALEPRPVVLRSGWIVVAPDRYFPGSAIGKATDPNDLGARVREVAARGVPWFKFIADFPGDDMDLFAAPLAFPLATVRSAVATAHALGVRVMAHSTGPRVVELVDCGVDAIEHGCSIDAAVARQMAERGVAWTPTLATVESHLLQAESLGASHAPRQRWAQRMREALPVAVGRGCPVMVGSDELPHGSIDREMDALVRHGLSPTEALAAATTVARRFLGLQAIEIGAPADAVTFADDPRREPAVVGRPTAVVAAGRVVVPADGGALHG
jgi:imidazolonepropionase-like amidohydrolase